MGGRRAPDGLDARLCSIVRLFFLRSVRTAGDHANGHHDGDDDTESTHDAQEGGVGVRVGSGNGQSRDGREEDGGHDQDGNDDGDDSVNDFRNIHISSPHLL